MILLSSLTNIPMGSPIERNGVTQEHPKKGQNPLKWKKVTNNSDYPLQEVPSSCTCVSCPKPRIQIQHAQRNRSHAVLLIVRIAVCSSLVLHKFLHFMNGLVLLLAPYWRIIKEFVCYHQLSAYIDSGSMYLSISSL